MKKILLTFIFCFSLFLLNAQTWSPCGTGVGGYVVALKSYSGNLYVGGNGIARWNGTSWDTWAPFCAGGVYAMDTMNGKLYAGGDFQQMDNSYSFCASQWNNSTWNQMDNGLDYSNNIANPKIVTMATYNGNVYAGGDFNEDAGYSNKTNIFNNVAKWNDTNWVACDSGLDLATTLNGARVQALLEYNGELYAGGNFTYAGSNRMNFIARWNGTNWSPCGTGMNNAVSSLEIYNGELYAGGYFDTAGGIPANHIAKWNGTNWSACDSGTNNAVRAIKVFCGKLYVGGLFAIAGGNPANRIATWDGTSWSTCGSGVNSSVFALEVFNGKLYAGGMFTVAGGNPANHIAIYDTLTLGVQNQIISDQDISIFPNPTSGNISLQINSPNGNKIEIEIFDVLGQSVLEKKEENVSENFNENLDLSALSNGFYFVSIKVDDKIIDTKKIVKED